MIQELLALGFPIGKYILAAALMVVFYWFLFREKATFNNCRLYLLSIALVAILISQFSIVVYTPPAEIVEIEAVQTMPIISNNQSAISQVPVLAASPKPVEKVAEPNKYLALLTVKKVALAVYITVTSILFILLLIQLFSILALKRRGKLTVKDGFEMVESAEIPTPFSFYKTIFLSPNLTGSKLEMILKHEQWHIKHRHYLDVFIIEVLVRLFWFNPVLWWVRRELRNVSEFHADRSVLDEGHNLYKYQTVILEEVMENNPYLANGFNNSFTKKRFIIMKNKYQTRYVMLRRALILPFIIGIFSLLCFTTGKSEVKYNVKNSGATDSLTEKSKIVDTIGYVVDSVTGVVSGYAIDSLPTYNNTREAAMKPINDFSKHLVQVINMLHELAYNNSTTVTSKDLNQIVNLLDVKFVNIDLGKTLYSADFLKSITKKDFETSFLYLLKIRKEIFMLRHESNMYRKTKLFRNILGKIMQDELVSKIINESVRILPPNAGMQPTTTISEFEPIAPKIKENHVAIQKTKAQYNKNLNQDYLVKPEQIKFSSLSYYTKNVRTIKMMKQKRISQHELYRYSRKVQIKSIDTRDIKKTLVTLAIPIRNKNSRVWIDKSYRIIDKKTQDQYLIRRLEPNMPLNKKLVFKDCNEIMIEITLVFPALKKSIETIDITPLGDNGWSFEDVNIKDYSFTDPGKVYR
ncbi:MAG: hypothetical protein JZU53_03840 [Paludibacter sp.]|nr:hypothetical protein [Paludibacter sp.]